MSVTQVGNVLAGVKIRRAGVAIAASSLAADAIDGGKGRNRDGFTGHFLVAFPVPAKPIPPLRGRPF
jgi:hypothetical protein